ncbi:hypothetical protein PIB30_027800 [Stylosanthes scabra]|uniref:Endonuclease/exonuclease/phosphatase domain-containing protein n=1 Tax=Stylosanthes scabra TaxID=79078 RepID=A0ABU6SA92_9FABA|nr:hypothetical protein [Stylosanthes scabra]
MLSVIRRKLGHLCSKIWWILWKRPRSKVVIRRFRKLSCKSQSRAELCKCSKKPAIHSNGGGRFVEEYEAGRPIRVATFNVAMFSLAPAVSELDDCLVPENHGQGSNKKNSKKRVEFPPKSILKQSPLHSDSKIVPRSNLKVSINLPDNEISLANSRLLASMREKEGTTVPARSPVCFPFLMNQCALGMKFVFAESWAPEFGNAILSKWPIKRWRVQKIADDEDFRNVLKATIDVPWAGEINFHSTQLDHLDESWRMKQVNAIIRSNDPPHILAGGLNSLYGADYSSQRWNDIVKYYEKLGKPRPKTDVMNLMISKDYVDAKDYAGECEPIVIIAKGQNVQGTCKYGTRVDYILASPNSPYKYVPGSYSVISSKGTSDHHIVKVDIVKVNTFAQRQCRKLKKKVVRITPPCSASATSVCKSTSTPYLVETKHQN